MSFKCEFCKTTAPNGTKMRMVPVEVRHKTYKNGSVGQEIVKEKSCCESCWLAGIEAPVTIQMPPGLMMSYTTLRSAKDFTRPEGFIASLNYCS